MIAKVLKSIYHLEVRGDLGREQEDYKGKGLPLLSRLRLVFSLRTGCNNKDNNNNNDAVVESRSAQHNSDHASDVLCDDYRGSLCRGRLYGLFVYPTDMSR